MWLVFVDNNGGVLELAGGDGGVEIVTAGASSHTRGYSHRRTRLAGMHPKGAAWTLPLYSMFSRLSYHLVGLIS